MSSAVIVLVYALAVARVTRLINEDKLTERPRDALITRLWTRAVGDPQVARVAAADPDAVPPPLVYLVTCPWCVSIYVAAIAAPIMYWWGTQPWFLVPALVLAFSHVTGLLAKIGG